MSPVSSIARGGGPSVIGSEGDASGEALSGAQVDPVADRGVRAGEAGGAWFRLGDPCGYRGRYALYRLGVRHAGDDGRGGALAGAVAGVVAAGAVRGRAQGG